MLLEELAEELVEVTSSLVGGRTINIMNTEGVIIASSERERVGTYHQGAWEAAHTGRAVSIHKDQVDRYPGAKEGCNMPLRVGGMIIGVVGIYGDPEMVRDVAHLLEGYATKYYQLEAMMRPRLAESALRSQLLLSLLSPPNSALSAANALLEQLNIHFQFPVYVAVISSKQGLSRTQSAQHLCNQLEVLGFQRKQCDVWGVVDERMVLLCSEQENRDAGDLRRLTGDYRVALGTPCGTLWEIQNAYDQASALDLSGGERFHDIRNTSDRCIYMLSRTATLEAGFLDSLANQIEDAFGAENGRVLLESTQAYYDCGRSVSMAAQQQFIHKNTLQYRVKRVLEVLDLGKLPPFYQEYLVRLLIGHLHRKSRSSDLEK